MVAITVISGVDYFFGLRRLLREAEERRRSAQKGGQRGRDERDGGTHAECIGRASRCLYPQF
jgi:hypothetical protein